MGLAVALRLAVPSHARPETDVVEHAHMREECVALKHGVDAALLGGEAGYVVAANRHAPSIRALEPCDDPHEVVLPLPEGPSTARNSPASTSSESS